MNKQIDLKLVAALAGGLLFSYLFWMEQQALNLLIYSVFVILILFLDQKLSKNKKAILAGGSHLLAAILVVVNNSDLSVITWYISLAVFIGFAHFPALRTIFTTILMAFLQFVTAPFNMLKRIIALRIGGVSLKPILKPIKYIVIPVFIIFLFSVIYSIANPVFERYVSLFISNIGTAIENVFSFFFDDLSFARLMHVLFGVVFSTAVLIGRENKQLEAMESSFQEVLVRNRKIGRRKYLVHEISAVFTGDLLNRKMALKTENIIGIISFAALNALLLFLNAIDISTLWLADVNSKAGTNLSAELHEGTNALILSIVMAMLVIIYFFSGNLNFYSRNKTLRLLSYIWILQNGFLVCSVLLRDYHYIDMHGLTYKRIGVLIFLLLCTVGLITVYLKVSKQKTFFYLLKINGLIWYVLMLLFGFVNWDVFIVRYNIKNSGNIRLDFEHLISMSDKTLPLLLSNKNLLEKYLPSSEYANRYVADSNEDAEKAIKRSITEQIAAFENDLNARVTHFEARYAETSWLSWNYRNWLTHHYLIRNQNSRNK